MQHGLIIEEGEKALPGKAQYDESTINLIDMEKAALLAAERLVNKDGKTGTETK